MRTYRSSGMGCFFLLLLAVFILIFVLRLFGTLVFGIISNPVLFLIIVFLILLSRGSMYRREEEKPSEPTVDYEFIDDEEEDPDS